MNIEIVRNNLGAVAKPFARINVKIWHTIGEKFHQKTMCMVYKNNDRIRYIKFPCVRFFFE